MRRRKQWNPCVESVEQRLSLSAVGAAIPDSLAATPISREARVSQVGEPEPASASTQAVELENTMVSNFSRPRPQGGQQIIAILIGL